MWINGREGISVAPSSPLGMRGLPGVRTAPQAAWPSPSVMHLHALHWLWLAMQQGAAVPAFWPAAAMDTTGMELAAGIGPPGSALRAGAEALVASSRAGAGVEGRPKQQLVDSGYAFNVDADGLLPGIIGTRSVACTGSAACRLHVNPLFGTLEHLGPDPQCQGSDEASVSPVRCVRDLSCAHQTWLEHKIGRYPLRSQFKLW